MILSVNVISPPILNRNKKYYGISVTVKKFYKKGT